MEKYYEFGDKIKNRRLALNLTSSYVAKKAGITRATLSAIENGSTKCTLNNLINILKVLNLDLFIKSESNIKTKRKRATRRVTKRMKDINEFIVFSVEKYASKVNKPSDIIYKEMEKHGLIQYLEDYYDDMHGMSYQYINEEIDDVLKNNRYLKKKRS